MAIEAAVTGKASGRPYNSISAWMMAARPRTLSLSTAPVIVGAALAWAGTRQIDWPAVSAAFVASMFIQLGTNLHNDAADSWRGGDGPDRIGPPRATASGVLDGAAVNRAACGCFFVAALLGVYLIWVGGGPIFWLGVASILSGWAYTGGPLPIAYTPLGEVFVIAFFGVGAVGGTYWLCTGALSPPAIEAGLAVGLFTGAVLLVNNHRDAEADARVGRRTLAIIGGSIVTTWIYALLMLSPFVLLLPLAQGLPRSYVWLALLALPPAAFLIYRFAREPRGRGFNRILVQTVMVQTLFSALLALGLIFIKSDHAVGASSKLSLDCTIGTSDLQYCFRHRMLPS